MAEVVNVKNTGLRGVTVADSKISFIDGEKGILIYRGYRIEELADSSTYPETAYLLLNGDLPSDSELKIFNDQLIESRRVPGFVFEAMKALPKNALPMDVLQAVVPMLAMSDPDTDGKNRASMEKVASRLIGAFPTIVAGWHRIRNGLDPLEPDESLTHAANFLWMLNGEKPDDQTAKDLDMLLILQADHTFNASTFACRQVVSTQADMYAGISGGLAALSGPLHGGANTEVMNMLLEVKDLKDLEAWIVGRLDRGEKIMGLGHAVYKTTDPRAKFLREVGPRLGEKTGQNWTDLSMKIEDIAVKEFEKRGKKGIKPNVDFWTGPTLYMMGFPVDLMTPVFAVSRIAGWCAHIIEESLGEAGQKPALYRPAAEYIGNYCGLMGCEYSPISERNTNA